MRPLGFGVLVKPDPLENDLKQSPDSKIVIPDSVKDRQRIEISTGIIVGIGAAAWRDLADGQPWANVGQRVLFAKYGGKLFKDPKTNEDYVLLQDRDILMLIEDEEVEPYND